MPFIKNKHISLRGLEREDLRYLYELENDESIQEFGSSLMPTTKYVLKQFIDNSDKDIFETRQLRLVIEHNESCEIVGLIDLFNFDPFHQRGEVGIIIDETQRQKGYAREALESLCNYAFDNLMMNQLFCHISEDNKASINLFEKEEFSISGQLDQWLRKKKTFANVFILQRLNKSI